MKATIKNAVALYELVNSQAIAPRTNICIFIPIKEKVEEVHSRRKSLIAKTERVVRREGLDAVRFVAFVLLVIHSRT